MKQYNGYIFDLDGTLYVGTKRLLEAEAFLKKVQAKNIPYLLMTNNTTQPPEAVQEKLKKHYELDVPKRAIYTAAMATADYLRQEGITKSLYVIGEAGLLQYLQARGFDVCCKTPEAVVVGLDRHITYEKLTDATQAILSGARLIGTNADRLIPTEHGLCPGGGSLAKLLAYATRQPVQFIGKPEAYMYQQALQLLQTSPEKTLMIGDNYLTDIQGAMHVGMDTALVYTGFTRPEEILDPAPTYTCHTLADLCCL